MTQMCSLLTETKIEHLFPLPTLSGQYHVVVDVEMLVLVMNDLDQLVPGPLQPEQRGGLLEVGQSVVELEREESKWTFS